MRRCLRCLTAALLWTAAPAPARAEARRIVSLLPSHTDILAVLGALDRVVGVSDAEDPLLYPRLPRVGGMDISWEPLVALAPDLILADVSHQRHDALFQRLRLPVVYLPSTEAASPEDVFALVAEIGRRIDKEEAAVRWINEATRRVKALDRRRLAAPGPLVYFEIWPQPLQACGPRSLPGHLLARLGARNVIADAGSSVPLVSMEAVVRADPDLILHTGLVSSAAVAARPGWAGIKAVRSGRVVEVDPDDFSRAGPSLLDAFETLAEILEKDASRGGP